MAEWPEAPDQQTFCVQKELEGHEEAQNELMLVDDEDAARFLFGQCFVHTSTEDADARITKGALALLAPRMQCSAPNTMLTCADIAVAMHLACDCLL